MITANVSGRLAFMVRGEMLAGMEKAKGGQPEKNRCNDVTGSFDAPTLSEIGITKRQSSDWQRLEKAKGTRGNIQEVTGGHIVLPPEDETPTLSERGITKQQSSEGKTDERK